ncbi:MAG: hypothetical protein V4513_03280 [Pseudomonadota bacterium]
MDLDYLHLRRGKLPTPDARASSERSRNVQSALSRGYVEQTGELRRVLAEEHQA